MLHFRISMKMPSWCLFSPRTFLPSEYVVGDEIAVLFPSPLRHDRSHGHDRDDAGHFTPFETRHLVRIEFFIEQIGADGAPAAPQRTRQLKS